MLYPITRQSTPLNDPDVKLVWEFIFDCKVVEKELRLAWTELAYVA